jgi:hypothetical protein
MKRHIRFPFSAIQRCLRDCSKYIYGPIFSNLALPIHQPEIEEHLPLRYVHVLLKIIGSVATKAERTTLTANSTQHVLSGSVLLLLVLPLLYSRRAVPFIGCDQRFHFLMYELCCTDAHPVVILGNWRSCFACSNSWHA